MNYSRFISIIIFILLSVTGYTADQDPNIVIILSDDQAWTDYGFMGHPHIQTPNIDRLAYEGLTYTRGYVPTSLCCPSLASIISGLYPHQHKITSNDPAPVNGKKAGDEYQQLRKQKNDFIKQVPSIPRILAKKGYVSFQSGKWWQGNYSSGGFTEGMTHGDFSKGGRHGDEGLIIGRNGMQPVFDFIDRAGDTPFFLWYAPFLPHSPHNPPDRLLNKYKDKTDSLFVAKYWAMCEWFDETCGELLDYLDKKKLTENTMVIYVCDNGWIQTADSRKFAPKSKQSPYDGGIRTPIMVRWPQKLKPQTVFEPVSSIDIAPTILHACGILPTKEMSGVDLTDLNAVRNRDTIYGDLYMHDAKDLSDPITSLTFRWCIQDRWKLIVPQPDNVEVSRNEKWGNRKQGTIEIELFDILADPHETKNLAAQYPEKVKRLNEEIDRWYPIDRSSDE
jgi:arylsulfatase A-like enzyme